MAGIFFGLGAQAQLAIQKADECTLKTSTQVTNIKDVRNHNLDYNWQISIRTKFIKSTYLVECMRI